MNYTATVHRLFFLFSWVYVRYLVNSRFQGQIWLLLFGYLCIFFDGVYNHYEIMTFMRVKRKFQKSLHFSIPDTLR